MEIRFKHTDTPRDAAAPYPWSGFNSIEAVFLVASSCHPREDVTRMLRGKQSRGI